MSDPHMQARPAVNGADDTKVCPFCAETIKQAAVVCRYCGRELAPLPATPNGTSAQTAFELQPDASQKKKTNGCAQVIGYSFLAVLALVVLAMIGSVLSTSGTARTPSATSVPTRTAAQIKSSAMTISYDTLARNTESHVGKTVYFRGDVIQVMESSWNDSMDLRVSVPDGDVMYVHYGDGPRVLEGDTVDFYAEVDGRLTYETVLGAEITIPEVTALVLTVVN